MSLPPFLRRNGATILSFALPLLMIPGIWLGRVVFFRDLYALYLPSRQMFLRAVGSGCLPTWSGELGFGQPLLANPATTAANPLLALLTFLPPDRLLTIASALHLGLLGLGAFLLARRCGLGAAPALLVSVAFSGSGPALSGVNLCLTLGSLAWLPWAALGLQSALLASGWARAFRSALAGAALALVVLAGEPAVALLAGAMLALWALVGPLHLSGDRHPARPPLSGRLGCLAITCVLAVGLSAYLLLPAVEMLRNSPRGTGFTAEEAAGWELPLPRLVELAVPGFSGRTDTLPPWDYWGRNLYEGGGIPYVLGLYSGAFVLLLALAGLSPRSAIPLLGTATVSLLLALGGATPLFALFRMLPGIGGILRSPERFVAGIALPVALLAGAGAASLLSGEARARRILVAGAGIAIIAIASSLVALSLVPDQARSLLAWLFHTGRDIPGEALEAMGRGVTTGLLHAGIAAIGILLVASSLRRPAWMVVLVFLDLALGNAALNPTARASLLRTPPLLTPPVAGRLYRPPSPDPVVLRAPDNRIEHWTKWDREHDAPTVAAGRGTRVALENDPYEMGPRRTDRVRKLFATLPPHLQTRLLALVGVTEARSFEGGYHAVPVPGALPRAFVAVRARRLDAPQDIWRLLLEDPRFDPRTEAVVSDAPPPPAGSGGEAWIEQDLPTRVTVRTRGGGGLLILLDSYYPGWGARLDGRPVPILRANYLFRAVALPAGNHHVVFHYRPASIRVGAALTLLHIAVLLALAAFALTRRGR